MLFGQSISVVSTVSAISYRCDFSAAVFGQMLIEQAGNTS